MSQSLFKQRDSFDITLRKRIEEFFQTNAKKQTGDYRLYLKAIFSVLGFAVTYMLLLLLDHSILSATALLFLFVQFNILIAFNIMHDSGHQSFSSKDWLNKLSFLSLDLIGGSSFIWKQKHNHLHHPYTNIDKKDDDLENGALLRLSPLQDKKWWHKFQFVYAPMLYALLTLYISFYTDIKRLLSKKVGPVEIKEIKSSDYISFFGFKAFYILYTLVIPSFFHSFSNVLLCFIAGHLLFGLTISLVFQLAHTVDVTSFESESSLKQNPSTWTEHQLKTTCGFSHKNPLVTFYCGGLNFQVEHHIFTRISHIHYPQLSKILKKTCEEFNKPYLIKETLFSAIYGHFKFLKLMGK